jgi:Tol biopolymer transport system component
VLVLTFAITAMAQDEAAGSEKKEKKNLPLEPGRTFDFDLSEGSWIALDVSPDGKTIVFDFLGDIYSIPITGGPATQLTAGMPFDAQPRFSPDGKKIVFTSLRTGDLELFIMDIDGSNVVQITDELGYDGGAFFSPDGTELIFRASRPKTDEEVEKYTSLLAEGMVEPTNMELFLVNIDGTNMRQITELGNANWAPFFHPDGDKIIFSSNYNSERGFPFNLFMINPDGTGLEQITFDETFDSFPMFSHDGKKLVFSSNRFNGGDRSTNVFIADWVK